MPTVSTPLYVSQALSVPVCDRLAVCESAIHFGSSSRAHTSVAVEMVSLAME